MTRHPGGDVDAESGWRRLDSRMLLVHPLQTFVRALPAIAAIFVARIGTDDTDRWELLVLPVVLALGLLRWFTTRYRVSGSQIELRRGLLNKQTTTARLDKVRTIDLTAQLHHRVLGLARVEISTGSAARERMVLDSLGVDEARRLRAELLHGVDPAFTALPAPTGPAYDVPVTIAADGPKDEELLRLHPTWVRFAPFTMTGIASAVAVLGFISQGFGRFPEEGDFFESGTRWVRGLDWWVGFLGVVLAVSLIGVVAYVLSFWGFCLSRNVAGSLHSRRGLLTNREVSIDRARLRGVALGEPLGLRWVGGRRLKAVSTGLEGERGGGSDWLAPPAPQRVVKALAAEVLLDRTAVTGPLTKHGPAARRRRLVRALWLPGVAAVALLAGRLLLDLPGVLFVLLVPLVALAWWLGRDRYRGLGHALTDRHLVTRSGSVNRTRVVLARDGIIGWKVEQSFFQRRAGIATLVATTGAGEQHYDLVDLTTARAYELIAEVDPLLPAQFS